MYVVWIVKFQSHLHILEIAVIPLEKIFYLFNTDKSPLLLEVQYFHNTYFKQTPHLS